jgi:hypothetical protein
LSYVYLEVEKRIPTWKSVGLFLVGKWFWLNPASAPYQLIQWGYTMYRRRSTTRWTQTDPTSSSMGHTRKENTRWLDGRWWHL